jgi:hypothetical protein
MDITGLLILVAVIAIVIVALYAVMQRVEMDPAVRNIITIAVIVLVAVLAIGVLLHSRGTIVTVP